MYRKNPFGNPDGAQATIEDLRKEFIDVVPPSAAVGGVGDDFTITRFIVGSKGSGKTHYIHMLRNRIKEKNLDNEQSTYITNVENSCAGTDQVIRFSHFFHHNILNEKWKMIWIHAVYAAVISHILNDANLVQRISGEEHGLLIGGLRAVGLTYDCKMGIYDYIIQILYINDTKNKVDSFIHNKEWNKLVSILKNSVLRKLPPMYFFLDSIDEDFEHAPQYWLKCQKGAFCAVSSLLKEQTIREKIHVVLCIRDTVFASIRRSEQQTKITNETHVLRLHWNYNTLTYFMNQKIQNLNECYFLSLPGAEKSIRTWLGIKSIHNIVRDCDENITNYILRHTRSVPRDVINICNSLAQIKMMAVENPDLDIPNEIRRRVANCAKEIGDELITICAKQIAIDEIPVGAAKYQYEAAYTSVDDYSFSRFLKIKQVLSDFDKDTFSLHELDQIANRANELFERDAHIINILWMNGVLGYLQNGEAVFYLNHNSISTDIPRNHDKYVLRSCMIDSVEISNLGKVPIQ